MKRRNFIKTTALTAPAVLMGCSTGLVAPDMKSDPLTNKVKIAMLSMQRASWEQGVAAQALLELGDVELTIMMAKEAVLRQLPDGRLSVLYTDNGITDPAASGRAVLFAASHLEDQKMKEAGQKMADFLLNTNHRTESGILHHTMNAPEIWIDSMYMAPPFLAKAGYYDESVKQIEGFRDALWNGEKKLYSHRWDTVKEKFLNQKFWGVGNGWALAGISDVVNILPGEFSSDRASLISYVREHLDSCLEYMRSDGLFHNNLDEMDSFIETNLSQMIAYTIYSGVQSGWLDKSYMKKAELMRNAARSKVDDMGYVQGVCGAPHFNSPGVAAEGQAFFILMEAARQKTSIS